MTLPAATPDIAAQFRALHGLIGNTPMPAIDVRYRGRARRIYAKHESLSLTGSIKDRMALFVLEDAHRQVESGPVIASLRPRAAIRVSRLPQSGGRSVTL